MPARQLGPVSLALFLLFPTASGGADPRGSIAGRVVDPAGAPLAGITVALASPPAERRTGGDGSFAFDRLTAGGYSLVAYASGYTVGTAEVVVPAGGTAQLEIVLAEAAPTLEEIVVTSSFSLLTDQPVAPVALDRGQIEALPHFGDDLYRAIEVLPGVSGGDFSAAFSVRGGLHDEILVQLDGHELFEPFHLKDFQGVFSAVDPAIVGQVELTPGAFTAEYGDRMSGVLEMSSRSRSPRRTALGISFSNAWFNAARGFASGKGMWMGSLRRGYLDIVLQFAEDEEEEGDEDPDPRYLDAFAKVERELGDGQSLSIRLHLSDDDLTFEENQPGEVTTAETSYGNGLAGLNHLATLGDRGVVESLASVGKVDRDRRLDSVEVDEAVSIVDVRDLEIRTLKQDWSWQLGDRQLGKWGFELRRFEAEYDYLNDFFFDDPVDDPRFLPASGLTRFAGVFSSDHCGLYAADRMRLGGRFTLELGARWDRQSLTDDDQLSPRLNLVAEVGGRNLLRAGWGRFHQSQRPHELAVEFGETSFSRAQRAEQWSLGWEKLLQAGLTLRVDAYRREIDHPLRRYETLFDNFTPVPEIEEDRILVDAERVEASGIELYLRGPSGARFSWWVSYAVSEIFDVVDGRDQYRANDETHALTWNSSFRPGRKWELNWVWTYHTGWPATAIESELIRTSDGGFAAVETVGPFYDERYPAYHRLDLRASRRTRLKRGELTFFLDVQNLYNRDNVRGLDLEERFFTRLPDGRVRIDYEQVEWLGILPSFGVSFEW